MSVTERANAIEHRAKEMYYALCPLSSVLLWKDVDRKVQSAFLTMAIDELFPEQVAA